MLPRKPLKKRPRKPKMKMVRLSSGVTRIIRADYRGGLTGPEWHQLRSLVLKRDGNRCVKCGRGRKELKECCVPLQVNHIVPKARGGTDTPGNLQSECEECHKLNYHHGRMYQKVGLRKQTYKEKKLRGLEMKMRGIGQELGSRAKTTLTMNKDGLVRFSIQGGTKE